MLKVIKTKLSHFVCDSNEKLTKINDRRIKYPEHRYIYTLSTLKEIDTGLEYVFVENGGDNYVYKDITGERTLKHGSWIQVNSIRLYRKIKYLAYENELHNLTNNNRKINKTPYFKNGDKLFTLDTHIIYVYNDKTDEWLISLETVGAAGGSGAFFDNAEILQNLTEENGMLKYKDYNIGKMQGLPSVFINAEGIGNLVSKESGEVRGAFEAHIHGKIIKNYCTAKVQGSSSANYPKKNFTIKLFHDAECTDKDKVNVGWGKENKYCFKANYVDALHVRNIACARVVKDMVEERPESEFKTNLLKAPCNGAIDGFPVKMYINDTFVGLYTWNIPKDDWMFAMDGDNPNHCVLGINTNNGTNLNPGEGIRVGEFRKEWSGIDGDVFDVEVGTLSQAIVDSINRCITFTRTATDTEFKTNIRDYFDLDSLLDYYVFSLFINHLDGFGKNVLLATYDGVHWGACLYDLDSTFGAWWNGKGFVEPDFICPAQATENGSLLWERLAYNFEAELKERYETLRKGALSTGNIINHVEEIYDLIPDRTYDQDKEKWVNLPCSDTNTIQRFRNYVKDRASEIDNFKSKHVLYELKDTVFDGSTTVIDTGIKLFDTAKDFTIIMDFTPDKTATSKGIIFSNSGLTCLNNNASGGILFSSDTVDSICTFAQNTTNIKITIMVKNGVVDCVKYGDNYSGISGAVQPNAYSSNSENLILGCDQKDGVKSNFWKGTINRLYVLDYKFQDYTNRFE